MGRLDREKNSVIYIILIIVTGTIIYLLANFDIESVANAGILLGVLGMLGYIYKTLVITPKLKKEYFKASELDTRVMITDYMPFIGDNFVYETQSGVLITYICTSMIIICLSLLFAPLTVIGVDIDQSTTVKAYIALLGILAYVVMDIIRGIAYLNMKREVYSILKSFGGVIFTDKLGWISSLIVFIPVLRVISMIEIMQQLERINVYVERNKSVKLKESL